MNAIRTWMAGTLAVRSSGAERATLLVFAATIFLSAALLFAVQPMFAKMVLPALGGSPSVWAVSMCFFQAALLAGYCYAHLLIRRFDLRWALSIHLGVLAAAAVALPIGLPASAAEPPTGSTYAWLIGVLALGVGLPFFAISANAPLLQAWFARSGHPHARDPYFLYAASNVGSLLALVSYPVVVEPLLGLKTQSAFWASGFAVLALAIAVCGLAAIRGATRSVAVASIDARANAATAAPLTWQRIAAWVGLSFVPSALLVALTTYVTTDIASAPFLWVVPLAMYLATFIMVFREAPTVGHEALVERLPLVVAVALFGTCSISAANWTIGMASGLAAFLVTSLVCHRELYLRRPEAGELTAFYLWMSFGGVLGGIFSALVAPQIFTSIFEFPLLLVAGLLARPAMAGLWSDRDALRRALVLAIAAAAVFVAVDELIAGGFVTGHFKLRVAVMAALVGAALLSRRDRARELAVFAAMLAATVLLPEGRGTLHAVRSFFGVHRVVETPEGDVRILMHGTTAHGAERRMAATGDPVAAPALTSYYYAEGPMARSLALARGQEAGGKLRVGIVGLGAGTFACNARGGDVWRYFEIDQAVVKIARDSGLFHFLQHCLPEGDIVVGDARLTLAHEAPGSFGFLLIDAFSSDSVPTHLLTVEALRLYLDKLAGDGLLVMHISNRHLDLAPVIAAAAAQIPDLGAVLVNDRPANPGIDTAPSTVVVLSRDRTKIEPALAWPGAARLVPSGVAAWTDDYSDVLSAMLRGGGQH